MSSFHPQFRLNGNSFDSVVELLDYVQQFHQDLYPFLSEWFSSTTNIKVTTSGSTGTPKLITLKKQFMINSAKATGDFFNLPEKTSALQCLSVDYIAGKMMLVRALTLGWHLDVVSSLSKVTIDKKYDFGAMVPLQLRNSISEIHKISTLIVGGGVVANDLLISIQKIPTKVYATYGMTETITHIAVKKLNHCSDFERSYYKALSDVFIYIDERSCLCIKAPKVSDEFVVTNDVVQLISDTEFEWLGRFDNIINSGGIKLQPEKIEEQLTEIIDSRFFVYGIDDDVLGQKLILVVENSLSDRQLSSLKEKIISLSTLSKYEKPKEVFCVEKFQETPTKKIQRKKTISLLNL